MTKNDVENRIWELSLEIQDVEDESKRGFQQEEEDREYERPISESEFNIIYSTDELIINGETYEIGQRECNVVGWFGEGMS